MEWLESNNNISGSNLSTHSGSGFLDLFEVYKAKETQQFVIYQAVGYIFGTIIFLSNITVVISSGLILKKGLLDYFLSVAFFVIHTVLFFILLFIVFFYNMLFDVHDSSLTA